MPRLTILWLGLEKNGLMLVNRVLMVRNVVEQVGTMVKVSQDCPAFRSTEVVGMVNMF